jgi:hypothetical protein
MGYNVLAIKSVEVAEMGKTTKSQENTMVIAWLCKQISWGSGLILLHSALPELEVVCAAVRSSYVSTEC